jgi:hypothetical protein
MSAPRHSPACAGFHAAAVLNRRHALRVGGLGLLGFTMPKLLQAAEKQAKAPPARAKSVIFLFQFGGPSHLETFDMKPGAPEGVRGSHKPVSSNADGIQISEHLPQLAKVMDKVTLVRTMHHRTNNHNPASYYAISGHEPPVDDITLRDSPDLHPAYGSVVDKLAPVSGDMPTFVAYPHIIRDGVVTAGQAASFLGRRHDPLLVTQNPNDPNFALPELSLPSDISPERLQQRREIQKLIDAQTRLLDYSATARGINDYYERALAMLTSPRLRRAFDLASEPDKVRDRYGRTTYGQSVLLARRLVEAGTKFVNVYFSNSIGGQSTTSGGWDTHGNNGTKMHPILEKYHLPVTDQSLSALLTELDERGLLDTTLVVWMGEFGRTPKINEKASRDHWPQCYTALLAGGGVKRGYVHGESDKTGSFPARDPVRPDDLAATLYHLLGIDPATEVYDQSNRPLMISSGKPVMGVVA